MNTYAILFGIIVVTAIAFYIISSYNFYNSYVENESTESTESNESTESTDIVGIPRREKDRVRCPPKRPSEVLLKENVPPSQNISIYEDDTKIANKGFVNELIYKPANNKSYVDYGKNQITTPSIPLNDVCETQNLPIGNIHVSFLLDKSNNKDAKLIL